MKKLSLFVAVMSMASVSLYSASDRMDIFTPDGSFVSVMTDDIERIAVVGDRSEGYHSVEVTLANGEVITGKIADMKELLYRRADNTTVFEIAREDAPNARVVMLDCRNNDGVIDPTMPEDWRASEADGIPHFQIKTDKGYESAFKIVGQYTGKTYTDNENFVFVSDKDDNLLGIDCLAFLMPFEPVTMTAQSDILHTYDGQAFLGNYSGTLIATENGRMSVNPARTFSIEMRGNGTYTFTSTDEMEFDVLDLYVYNAEKGSFAYVPYEGPLLNEIDLEVKYGADGRFVDGDFAFVDIHSVIEDKPENTRHYFVGKSDHNIVIADADDNGFRRLLEVAPASGTKQWFWIENYGYLLTPVVMNFGEGSSIGEDGAVGYAMVDGENIFRYQKDAGKEPVFTMRGDEYGSYDGLGGDLDLDGFGNATWGADFGLDYEIEGGLVTITDLSGITHIFVIDKADMTYTELTSTPWDGPLNYISEEATGSLRGEEETFGHYVRIAIDQNFDGSSNPGYCAVEVNLHRGDGMSDVTAIASGGKYIYDAEGGRIIITNVLYGTDATSSARHNLILRIADDKQSLWFDDSRSDKVYGSGCDGSYILAGQTNAIAAEVTVPEVTLAPSYSGNLKMSAFGSESDAATTVTFDVDLQKASISTTAMGAQLLNSSNLDYELTDDGRVILKQVEVGDPNLFGYGTTHEDLTFILGEDGNLIGVGATHVNAMGMLLDLKLEGCILTAAQ